MSVCVCVFNGIVEQPRNSSVYSYATNWVLMIGNLTMKQAFCTMAAISIRVSHFNRGVPLLGSYGTMVMINNQHKTTIRAKR